VRTIAIHQAATIDSETTQIDVPEIGSDAYNAISVDNSLLALFVVARFMRAHYALG
jgi:hypothetical protein